MLTYVASDGNKITVLSRGSIKANMAGKNDKRYYILRKDVVGIERQKKLGVRILGDDVNFNAIRGSIYLMNSSKLDSQENCTFTSVDNEGKSITCEKEDLYPLDQKEFQLLVAIPSNNERMLTFKSPLFEKIKRAKEGDFVKIDIESLIGIISVIGAIRYIGPMKNKKGYLFGLQLEEPIGDNNGFVDGHGYFFCQKNHGIFVPANRIKNIIKKSEKERHHSQPPKAPHSLPDKNTGSNQDASKKQQNENPESEKKKKKKKEEEMKEYYPGIEVGSRVVSFGIEGNKYVLGTIRYIGQLNKHRDLAEVVIETDNTMDKVSFCPLHKWKIIKLRGLVENVPRENIIVAGSEELLPEKDFLKEQAQYRNEGNKDTNGMVRKNDVVKEPSKNEVKKNLSKREGNTEPAMTEINKKPGSTENNTEPAMKETKNKPENNDVNNEEAMKEVKNEFAENVEDYFCCPICLEFAEDAVEASCCHKILCEKCVRGQKICPMCRENPFGFAPSHFARLFIGNLKTSCQNEGCDEQPTRSNLQYHLKKCEFQLVKCQSLYCDVSVLRSHLPKHALECDYRRMDCENPGCFSSFSAYGAAQHEQECLFTTVKCQNAGCDALMFRKDVETHLKFDCRFEIVVCPAPGCSFRDTSANVGHHLVDAHFQYFKKKNFVNTM